MIDPALLDYDSDACSIARSTAILGDRWSLLVIRDVLNGVRRFDQLAEHLEVSRDVLTRRLSTLVDGGILERVPYREPGERRRSEYRLTDAGRELVPVLLALMAWGDRHLSGPEGPPVRASHRNCGGDLAVRLVCSEGHQVDPVGEIRLEPGPGARRASRARPHRR